MSSEPHLFLQLTRVWGAIPYAHLVLCDLSQIRVAVVVAAHVMHGDCGALGRSGRRDAQPFERARPCESACVRGRHLANHACGAMRFLQWLPQSNETDKQTPQEAPAALHSSQCPYVVRSGVRTCGPGSGFGLGLGCCESSWMLSMALVWATDVSFTPLSQTNEMNDLE